ncbi:MAG: hypothetical protein V3W18_02085 [candidate division Zixibacteria bacterium]
MLIKKFIAPSLPEALSKVKDDFGEEAVILKTRFNNKGNGLGKEGRFVEVTAAIDKSEKTASQPAKTPKVKVPPTKNRIKAVAPKSVESPVPEKRIQNAATGPKSPSELLNEMKKDIDDLKNEFARGRKESLFGQPSGLQLEVGKSLIEKHLPESLALELVKGMPSVDEKESDKYWDILIGRLADTLGQSEPIKIVETGATVVMLIGSTGSGKSSAAARLAFQFTMEETARVTLVTTDNFRADSREQLMSLANVIGCSCTAVRSPDELAVFLKTIKTGLVIIDSSGYSTKEDINELSAFVGAANPHEIHLVVPADTPAGDITEFIRENPDLEVDKLFISKLDQTHYRGGVVGAAVQSDLKFSYQCSSRELPGDIELFSPKTFVSAFRPESKRPIVPSSVKSEVLA